MDGHETLPEPMIRRETAGIEAGPPAWLEAEGCWGHFLPRAAVATSGGPSLEF